MTRRAGARAWAEAQVAAVRDDPAGRLGLLERTYRGPIGRAPQHVLFRRAAVSFMRWQVQRGVLHPLIPTAGQRVVAGGQRAAAAGRV